MKVRESGMPSEQLWQTFFKPQQIIEKLGITSQTKDVVEFGCGYGTFTLPTANVIAGRVTSFELDPSMLSHTEARAQEADINNITYLSEDFYRATELLNRETFDYVMLFNILHAENPGELLNEAHALLAPGGKAGVMHWNFDPETPRGPPMAIRPRPESLAKLATELAFQVSPKIDLPPYHYGFILTRTSE